jgi:hypothetical protein
VRKAKSDAHNQLFDLCPVSNEKAINLLLKIKLANQIGESPF